MIDEAPTLSLFIVRYSDKMKTQITLNQLENHKSQRVRIVVQIKPRWYGKVSSSYRNVIDEKGWVISQYKNMRDNKCFLKIRRGQKLQTMVDGKLGQQAGTGEHLVSSAGQRILLLKQGCFGTREWSEQGLRKLNPSAVHGMDGVCTTKATREYIADREPWQWEVWGKKGFIRKVKRTWCLRAHEAQKETEMSAETQAWGCPGEGWWAMKGKRRCTRTWVGRCRVVAGADFPIGDFVFGGCICIFVGDLRWETGRDKFCWKPK